MNKEEKDTAYRIKITAASIKKFNMFIDEEKGFTPKDTVRCTKLENIKNNEFQQEMFLRGFMDGLAYMRDLIEDIKKEFVK